MTDIKRLRQLAGLNESVVKGPWGDKQVSQNIKTIQTGSGPQEVKSTPKKISLTQSFGSRAMNVAHDLGHPFQEKPSYFQSIKRTFPRSKLAKLEREIGFELDSFDIDEIMEMYKGEYYPQGELINPPDWLDPVVIIHNHQDGHDYLADTTQANTYIRMWTRIE